MWGSFVNPRAMEVEANGRHLKSKRTPGGEHTIQQTDDALWNCAPGTCVICTNQHHSHFLKKSKWKVSKWKHWI